jgi:hypothetical protein
MKKSTDSTNLADLLERVLDKGLVIAGDIKIKLVEVELLTIQLRLVVCSVDRARELGMDFWTTNPEFMGQRSRQSSLSAELADARDRIAELEAVVVNAAKLPLAATGHSDPCNPQPLTSDGLAHAHAEDRRIKPKLPFAS